MTGCANGKDCCQFQAPDGPGLAVDCPLCPGCVEAATRDVGALPGDYRALGAELTPAARGLQRRYAGTDLDPGGSPIALGVEELQRAIFWALTVWEPPVREAAGLSDGPSGPVRDLWAVEQAAAVLVPRVALLAGLPAIWGYADGLEAGPVARTGLEALRTLRDLHRRARYVIGVRDVVHRLPGQCSGCGAMALRRRDGSETVSCAHCDRRWTWDDYRRYVGLVLVEKGVTP